MHCRQPPLPKRKAKRGGGCVNAGVLGNNKEYITFNFKYHEKLLESFLFIFGIIELFLQFDSAKTLFKGWYSADIYN